MGYLFENYVYKKDDTTSEEFYMRRDDMFSTYHVNFVKKMVLPIKYKLLIEGYMWNLFSEYYYPTTE